MSNSGILPQSWTLSPSMKLVPLRLVSKEPDGKCLAGMVITLAASNPSICLPFLDGFKEGFVRSQLSRRYLQTT